MRVTVGRAGVPLRRRAPARILGLILVLTLGVGIPGASVLDASGASDGVGGAQAVAIVRTVLAVGLRCDYPGIVAVGPWSRRQLPDGNWRVTFRITRSSGRTASIPGRLEVDGQDGHVLNDNAFAANVVACGGPPPATQHCVTRRAGLTAVPFGTPIRRYGPIALYARVPGLTITRQGRRWTISGVKLATLHAQWWLDGCTGNGTVFSAANASVLSHGRPVAVVGDATLGLEVSGCPSDPLHVRGRILTGDPRITIRGHPVAVAGSRVAYAPFCASGLGTLK